MESSEPFTLVSMSSSNTITLRSSDDEHFVVDPDVAMLSTTVWAIVEDAGTEDAVPLPNVSGTILAKVVEYCKHVVATDKAKGGEPPKGKSAEEHASAVQEASDAWDADFVKVDQVRSPRKRQRSFFRMGKTSDMGVRLRELYSS